MQQDKPESEIDFSDRFPGVKISPTDKFLFMLLSANLALRTSVVNPVIIHPRESPEVVAAMYYDCLENENDAKKIMKARITSFSDDINQHMQNFHQLSWFINQINQYLQKRMYKTEIVIALANNIKDYGTLITNHQRREGNFLEYPFTPSGHYEVFQDTHMTAQLSFNPERSLAGLKIDSHLLHMTAISEGIEIKGKDVLVKSFAQATSDLEEKIEKTEDLVDRVILANTSRFNSKSL